MNVLTEDGWIIALLFIQQRLHCRCPSLVDRSLCICTMHRCLSIVRLMSGSDNFSNPSPLFSVLYNEALRPKNLMN